MPKRWVDRAIMFSVIALVAWAIIGLPLFSSLTRPGNQPASEPSAQKPSGGSESQDSWLTKDAAGFFTFLLVIVGGFQVALFVWQLRLIRDSLDDAKEAADAAKEAADASKIQAVTGRETLKTIQDTALRQLRAYVFAEPITFANYLFNIPSRGVGAQPYGGIGGSHRKIHFEITFKNTGQTPAYEFRGLTASDVFDEPVAEANFALKPQGPQSRTTLASGASVNTGGDVHISNEDDAAIRDGRKSFTSTAKSNISTHFEYSGTLDSASCMAKTPRLMTWSMLRPATRR
ncbi:MAG: hypothetical protein WBD95_02600 [Xanthobacteraceae bacterium]